jgi:hypothetical protein
MKNFQAPPNEIGAERKTQRDLEQLDYEFVFWHGGKVAAPMEAPKR